MAYFPNGTSADIYWEAWCSRCIHESGGKECAVWNAHLLHNYDECNNEFSILHKLIPRDKETGQNQECRMFVEVKS